LTQTVRYGNSSGIATKCLYLLRHAKSSWDDPELADRERPLAPRGRKAASAMAKHLLKENIQPDLVLCSPSLRTRQTVERMAAALRRSPVEVEDDLYGAAATSLLERLRRVPDSHASVLLVGHNPGLHDLALALAGRGAPSRLAEKFPTGALATLEHDGSWAELGARSCTLTGFVLPRELR
jgi:phosphohistidine phosphatase